MKKNIFINALVCVFITSVLIDFSNLAYIKNDLDYVVFIYPFDNTALYDSNYQGKKLHQVEIKNFFQIDWHELCDMTLEITKGTNFYRHYLEFKEKYLSY